MRDCAVDRVSSPNEKERTPTLDLNNPNVPVVLDDVTVAILLERPVLKLGTVARLPVGDANLVPK